MNKTYKTGIYIRLSKEDKEKVNNDESQSIINQRNLIKKYIEENNFILIKEYVDDGYSGTTFNRPAFNEMIQDIENKNINCVITKDLSRLGRDYIKSGYYIEQYFPLKKVRYISILDNIDTIKDSSNNDIVPFKALFNDMTSKDTSKKIRSILRSKKEDGFFLGSSASYGYKKDPNNKHKLIINKEQAIIVRKIFDLALLGKSRSEICLYLNKEKIRTPILEKNHRISKRVTNPELWTISSINNILKNKIYTGTLIQGKQAKLSYKTNKRIILDSHNWIIKENNHEAIVTENEYNIVNSRSYNRKINTREKLLLEGLVYCKECNSILGVRKDYRKDNKYTLNCNKYTRNPKLKLCSSHFINYYELEKEVISNLDKYITNINKKELENKIINLLSSKINNYNEEKNKIENELKVLKNKRKSLYDDKYNKIITDKIYLHLSNDLENEINKKELEINNFIPKHSINYGQLINNCFKKPYTRELVFSLIEKISVDKDKVINIYYKFSKNVNK